MKSNSFACVVYYSHLLGVAVTRQNTFQILVAADGVTTTEEWNSIVEFFQTNGYPRYALSILGARSLLHKIRLHLKSLKPEGSSSDESSSEGSSDGLSVTAISSEETRIKGVKNSPSKNQPSPSNFHQ